MKNYWEKKSWSNASKNLTSPTSLDLISYVQKLLLRKTHPTSLPGNKCLGFGKQFQMGSWWVCQRDRNLLNPINNLFRKILSNSWRKKRQAYLNSYIFFLNAWDSKLDSYANRNYLTVCLKIVILISTISAGKDWRKKMRDWLYKTNFYKPERKFWENSRLKICQMNIIRIRSEWTYL